MTAGINGQRRAAASAALLFRILIHVNRTIESVLRFINLTASGLLAGSLGFGKAALVPGWKEELPRDDGQLDPLKTASYFNAIGPVALGTAVTLAIAAPRSGGPGRRILDSAAAVGLAGVLAATVMVTVPINKELETQPPADYPSDRSQSLVKNWARAHAVRTTLGIGAFVCAVAASSMKRHYAK
jgi:uncharacterized membrane protein